MLKDMKTLKTKKLITLLKNILLLKFKLNID